MSGRGGAAQSRGAAPGPQPLKATIPYQLASKPRPGRRDGKPASVESKPQQLRPGMRRTLSLDTIISPYLQGHWPGHGSIPCKDKSTQTPDSWSDRTQSKSGSGGGSSGHKRSASWGTEQLQEIAKLKQQLQQRNKPGVSGGHDRERPQGGCSLGTTQTQPISIPMAPLLTLVPRLRCSVEGLNQELEGMFICQPMHPQPRLLEVPDGHRAPVPLQRCSSGLETEPTSSTHFSSSSASSSPCASPDCIATSPPNPGDAPLETHYGLTESAEMCLLSPFSSQSDVDLSVPLLLSASPGPNKSCCFQREPPEGCEKVKVWEETTTQRHPKPVLVSSCPDPNKVNFTPHGGSAFCPVSLLKPLLPSMDLLFCNLSVSTVGGCSGLGLRSCQATPSSAARAAPGDTPAANNRANSLGDGRADGLAS